MKPINTRIRYFSLAAAVAALSLAAPDARAQSSWTGGASDGLWNSAGNWDSGVPSEFLPGLISSGFSVNYDAPMTAASIIGLTLGGSLSVNAVGFNIDPFGGIPLSLTNGSSLTINSGGVVAITNAGLFRMMDRNTRLAVEGGTLELANNFGTVTIGENGNTTETAVTNNGGAITIDQTLEVRGRFTGFYMSDGTLDLLAGGGVYEGNNDNERKFYIGGGTANLGDFLLARTQNGVAQAGLIISNGVVNFTSLRVGTANAASGATVAGGVVTNTGPFIIHDRNNGATSGNRRIHFYQLGGSIYSTDPAGIIVANQSNGGSASANIMGGFLDIRGGLLLAEGITLVLDNTLSNAHATLNLSGGEVYLGPVGLIGNVGVADTSYTMNLNGGTLGAQSDFSIIGDGTLGGDFILKAADQGDVAHNVNHTGVWSGSGALIKTGGGTLTLEGANTYSGDTTIAEGTLALGAAGSILNSPRIEVAAGTTFDASLPGFFMSGSQTLAGNGTVQGSVITSSGSTISPGVSAGVLTFANDLSLAAGAISSFELSGATNDTVVVSGNLDISGGASTVLISALAGGIPEGTYTLFEYGTLSGDIANLNLTGVSGTLINDTVARTISVTTEPVRAAANLTWIGNAAANNWDVLNTTNWLNAGSLDFFLPGDEVLFDGTGAANPNVNISDIVQPSSVTVDSAADYSFSGAGHITGSGNLIKTNSGKLSVETVNDYNGATILGGGSLEVSMIAASGVASSIGAASSNPTNLLFNGGSLEYIGSGASTDRGATVGSGGGTIDVTNALVQLSISGQVNGTGVLTKRGAGDLYLVAANNYSGGTVVKGGIIRADQGGNATITAFGTGPLTLDSEIEYAVLQFDGDQQKLLNNALNIVGTNNFTQNNGNNSVGAMTGDGTLVLDSPGGNTLSIEGDMSGFSGTLIVGTLPNLRLHPSTGSGAATFDLGTGTGYLNNRNAPPLIQLGALRGGPATELRGASSAGGTTVYQIGGNDESTLFEGTIVNASGTAAVGKVGTGTLTLSGNHTYTGATTIESGVLALTNFATLASSSIIVGAGGMLDISGLFTPTLYVNIGQTLGGNGTVIGDIDNSTGGIIAPGTSIGTLTVNGNANLFGETVMEISSPNNSDKLVATTIQLSGTLTITNIGGNLQVGDTFDLFDGAITDNFPFVVTPQGYTFDTSQLAVNGTITVTAAPVPPQVDSIEFDASGTNVVLNGSGGTAFGLYDVLSSDNVAAPLSTWTELSVGNFYDVNGNFSFTNAVDPAEPMEYYLIRQQQ